jgi:putative oxidoreductase
MLKTKFIDLALLVLRLSFGGMMLYGHGWGKFLRLIGDEPIKFRDVFGMGAELSLTLAVFSEVVCALLVMVGLFTRWSLLPLIFTMFVAAFIAHGGDGFSEQEKALMYMVAFIGLFLSGPGKYSVDHQANIKI